MQGSLGHCYWQHGEVHNSNTNWVKLKICCRMQEGLNLTQHLSGNTFIYTRVCETRPEPRWPTSQDANLHVHTENSLKLETHCSSSMTDSVLNCEAFNNSLHFNTQSSFKDIKSCLPITRFKKRRSTWSMISSHLCLSAAAPWVSSWDSHSSWSLNTSHLFCCLQEKPWPNICDVL